MIDINNTRLKMFIVAGMWLIVGAIPPVNDMLTIPGMVILGLAICLTEKK